MHKAALSLPKQEKIMFINFSQLFITNVVSTIIIVIDFSDGQR